jgi:predicted DNA-binding mobile mystery protein A
MIVELVMGIQSTVLAQYQQILDRAAGQVGNLAVPKEGWIRTARKALGMSGAQLARRMDSSRAQVSHFEKREAEGNLTIKTLERAAAALGCRFVYAIVPESSAAKLISRRARDKARQVVASAHAQMAMEAQGLTQAQIDSETAILQQQFMRDMPADLWSDE